MLKKKITILTDDTISFANREKYHEKSHAIFVIARHIQVSMDLIA